MLKYVLVILASFATAVDAAAAEPIAPPKFDPPKPYYLALGDSVAFGFRFDVYNQHFPNVPAQLFHGYVEDFTAMLDSIRPGIQVVNYSCPGETTDSFIAGGCFYPAPLHDPYTGAQLGAALGFLAAHRGQVGPITFNLAANDLNQLAALCGNDVPCYFVQGPLFIARMEANIDAILGALRAAAPDSEIITFTNYSIATAFDERFRPLAEAFNGVVTRTAAAHGARVADVFDVFNGTQQQPRPQPQTICLLTLACVLNDPHPSDAGHGVIADELFEASGYERLLD